MLRATATVKRTTQEKRVKIVRYRIIVIHYAIQQLVVSAPFNIDVKKVVYMLLASPMAYDPILELANFHDKI